jgi:hypothetical protein
MKIAKILFHIGNAVPKLCRKCRRYITTLSYIPLSSQYILKSITIHLKGKIINVEQETGWVLKFFVVNLAQTTEGSYKYSLHPQIKVP